MKQPKKMKHVKRLISFDPEQMQQLELLKEEYGIPFSKVVRDGLKKELERYSDGQTDLPGIRELFRSRS